MNKILILITLSMTMTGCGLNKNGNPASIELISSKGEKIYIKTINWGMIDDYQLTLITSDKKRLKSMKDTSDAIKGLDPFLYSFQHDTLRLFLNKGNTFKIKEVFKTIKVQHNFVDEQDYLDLKFKLSTVPLTRKAIYPDNMPFPPRPK